MHWRRAIAARIDDGRDIPMPTATKRGEHAVSVPPSMALKAAVYLAVRDAGISNSELARRLHLDEKEARRILDPRHPIKLPRMEAALVRRSDGMCAWSLRSSSDVQPSPSLHLETLAGLSSSLRESQKSPTVLRA